MIDRATKLLRAARWTILFGLIGPLTSIAQPQAGPAQHSFPQSKAVVEKALQQMQPQLSGHLPALEGFANAAEHPLDRYSRGFFQATVQVVSTASGKSLVKISAKVTAWYSDPTNTKSGYQLLPSNGRIEADLLEQLAEKLGSPSIPDGAKNAPGTAPLSAADEASISAPGRRFPDTDKTFASSLSQGLSKMEPGGKETPSPASTNNALQAEFDSLQEILKKQAHPKNLVAVKKSGTPVVANPSLTAKAEFLASQHDEFELLDFNSDWVHVRISGISRGWIWRNSVEMPEGIPDTEGSASSAAQQPVADLFRVAHEETAQFPGDWEPLRSKKVKIISVRKIDESTSNVGPKERLDYAKFLLQKNYQEMSAKPQESSGIVVIFDSADGGMIAATLAALQQWKAGTLSDDALWHTCFFDPPETFNTSAPAGSQ